MVNSARIFPVESLETRFVWIQKSSFQAFLQEIYNSLRASSPIWASETSLARTRERAAKPREAEERRACNDPL